MLLATYGSLFPFDFRTRDVDGHAVLAFLASCCSHFSRGDALGNVVLFVPIGFFGILAGRAAVPCGRRLVVVCAIGLILAVVLQVAQFYLPTRFPSSQDVLWNMLGTFAGTFAGIGFRRLGGHRLAIANTGQSLPDLMLIGLWLAYRLIPFVPSIDLQAIKTSLKPLLLRPELSMTGVVHDAVAWLVVAFFGARLLRPANRPGSIGVLLSLLILATSGLEVLIVHNTLSLTNVIGAVAAMVIWGTVLCRLKTPAPVLVFLLMLAIATSGLSPFIWRSQPVELHWLPFHGFFGGSMVVNAQVACEKAFLYGSLIYLLWQTGLGRMGGVVLAIVLVSAVEVAQIWIQARLPEVTDPLLVVLMAAALLALQRSGRPQPDARPPVGSNRTPTVRWPA